MHYLNLQNIVGRNRYLLLPNTKKYASLTLFGPKWSLIVAVYAKKNCKKNRRQCHFVAQSILDKCWKFQPDSSNGTPVWSDRTKAVARTPTQLAANRLHTARMATLKSNEYRSILEVSIRCKDSAQEISQVYNVSVLCNNFRKLVFFVFYLSQNWVGFA